MLPLPAHLLIFDLLSDRFSRNDSIYCAPVHAPVFHACSLTVLPETMLPPMADVTAIIRELDWRLQQSLPFLFALTRDSLCFMIVFYDVVSCVRLWVRRSVSRCLRRPSAPSIHTHRHTSACDYCDVSNEPASVEPDSLAVLARICRPADSE